MSCRWSRSAVLACLVAAALLPVGCGSGGTGDTASEAATSESAPATTSGSSGESSPSAELTALYRAETGALATYRNVVGRLGAVRPFQNVIDSEQQHVHTITSLMTAHSVIIPGAEAGSAAPSTRSLACALGVRTEQHVIALYDAYLPQLSSYPDLVQALQKLRTASAQNHLPAFQQCD